MDTTFPAHETTRKRRRWGCTCGCLVFLLGLLAVLIGVFYYGLRPLAPAPKERWLPAASDGFGVLRLDASDPGISGMLALATRQLQQAESGGLSAEQRRAMEAWLQMLRQFAPAFVHNKVYVYFSLDSARAREQYLAVLQLKNLGTWFLLKVLLGQAQGPSAARAPGAELYQLRSDGQTSAAQIALSRRAVFVSNSTAMLRDALQETPAPRAAPPTHERLESYIDSYEIEDSEGGEDLSAVFVNDRDQLKVLLDGLERWLGLEGIVERLETRLSKERVQLSEVRAVRVGVDLVSADKMKWDVRLLSRSPESAKKLARALQEAVNQALEATRDSGVKRSAEVRSEGPNVLLSVEISGLKELLERTFSGRHERAPGSGGAPS